MIRTTKRTANRLGTTALLAGVLAATLPGCAAPNAASSAAAPAPSGLESRLDEVKAAKRLRVCTTGDYRPFTYLDPRTKRYVGIDVRMAMDLAKTLGVTIEWVPTTWKTLMDDFTAKCDVGVGGISVTAQRAERAFFSDPILAEGKSPITLCKNVAKYDTVAEINRAGVRSITPIGGTNEAWAVAHYPKGTIIRWADNNTIFDQIIAGKADVMTTDSSETVWVAKEKPQLCAVNPTRPFNYAEKAYLLPRGDDIFQEYVNQWLRFAKKSGVYATASKPWFGAITL